MEDNKMQNGVSPERKREEFVFEEKKTAMVFEAVTEPKKSSRPDEFQIPDTLSFDEKYNMPLPKEEMPRIWHTYVPRFTGASDSYRVRQSEKAAPEKKTVNVTAEREEKKEAPSREVERVAPEASASRIEEYAPVQTESVITVKSGSASEREDVFVRQKPQRDAAPETTEDRVHSLEDERDEVADLMAPLPKEEPRPSTRKENTEKYNETPQKSEEKQERIFRTVPDPVELREQSAPLPTEYQFPRDTALVPEQKRRLSEYTSISQRGTLKDRFLDTIMSIRVRLFATALLTLVCLVFENLGLFGVDTVALLGLEALPGALALVDLELIVALFALSLPEIFVGIRRMIHGQVRSELLLLVSFVIQFLYCVLIGVVAPVRYPLFGFAFGVTCIATILSAYSYENAKYRGFRLISEGGEKQVVHNTLTRTLEHENMALDGAVDEYKSKIARVFRTSFVPDFFKKHRDLSEDGKKMLITLCISMASALLVGVISFFVDDGMLSALPAFCAVFTLAIPAFLLLSHTLPYFCLERYASQEGSAAIGEPALYDTAGVDVVAYEDVEIFTEEDVALKRLKLFGDETNFSRPLRQMAALYSVVGGPLATLFESSLDRRVSSARNVEVEADGISGTVDGVTVLSGSEEYMRRHGVTIPEDDAAPTDSHTTMKVMYAAEEGAVYCKFYIRYSFSEEFSMLLPSLRDAGIVPLVYTRDPNITNELLGALTLGGGEIRVMKKDNLPSDDAPAYSRLDAGIVALGNKTSAINMILLSKRYTRFVSKLENLASISALVGILLAAALSLFVTPELPSLLFGLWQGVWMGVCAFLSASTFRFSKKSTKETQNECQN